MFKKSVIFLFCLAAGLAILYFVNNFSYPSLKFLTAEISSLFGREEKKIITEEPNLIEEDNLQIEEVISKDKQLEEEKNIEFSDAEEIQNKIDDILEKIDILRAELSKLLEDQSTTEEEVENIEEKATEEKVEEEKLEEPEEEELEEETEEFVQEEIGQGGVGQTLCFKITGFLPNQNRIIINEVAWMGSLEGSNDEWIELKNISGNEINLAGWQILDKEAKIKIIFSDKKVILPNDFLLLERTDDNSVPYVAADLIYTGALNDAAEELYLFNENCDLEDEASAIPDWPAGDKTDKRTMERKSDLSWQTSLNIGGTPKAQNSIGFVIVGGGSGGGGSKTISEPVYCSQENLSEPVHSPIILNEIAWMGTFENYSNEWFELKNISESEVSLNGWQILDKANQIKIIFGENDLIPSDGFYLLERTGDDSVSNITADKIYTGALGDEDETLRIFDRNCNLIDEIIASPDWPAGDKTEKRTMERSQDLNWHTYFGEGKNNIMGTPKEENSQPSIPEEIKDTTPPTVVFNPLFSPQTQLSFSLSWVAEDPIGNTTPSGIDGFYLQYTVTPSVDGVTPGLDGVWLQYQDESGNWLDWLVNEIKEFSAEINSLNLLGKDGYDYYFKIKAEDKAGNESFAETSVKIALLKNPLITEVQILPVEERFIELYNSNDIEFNLTGWYIQRKTKTGSSWVSLVSSTQFEGKIIQPNSTFLIARSSNINPDIIIEDLTLTDDNVILLKNSNREIIDKVGWGQAQDFENMPAENPPTGKSLSRKWSEEDQNYQDTDNNLEDFQITNPTPKAKNE